ncbi:MAG: hypothetical protein WAV28_03450 [Sedimentisphaerales bacterium]
MFTLCFSWYPDSLISTVRFPVDCVLISCSPDIHILGTLGTLVHLILYRASELTSSRLQAIVIYLPERFYKTPAFLRREGRRKRKAGAKNEKAVLIIAPYLPRSRKNSTNIQRKIFFAKNTPFLRIEKWEKSVYLCKK